MMFCALMAFTTSTGESPFAKYVGILGTFPGGIPEINQWIAEMRDEEE